MNNNPVFTSTPTVGSTAAKNITGLDSANLYAPGDLLPAEHANYFLGNLTSNGNTEQTALTNVCDEIGSVLTLAGVARNSGLTNQLATSTTLLINNQLNNVKVANWTQRVLPANAGWYSIAWNGTVFCATAASSTIAATSPDGITWTQRVLPANANWHAIAWNGTVFCAVAGYSTIAATSPDGITWTQRTLPVSANWYSIAWNGTVFCAIAVGSTIAATTFII